MTFDYTATRSVADQLLQRFGQSVVVRRSTAQPGDSPFDPGEDVTEDHPATGVLLEFDNRVIDDSLIKAGDRQVILSAQGLSLEPKVTDVLIAGGTDYVIVNVKPLSPAGIVVIYEIQVRA